LGFHCVILILIVFVAVLPVGTSLFSSGCHLCFCSLFSMVAWSPPFLILVFLNKSAQPYSCGELQLQSSLIDYAANIHLFFKILTQRPILGQYWTTQDFIGHRWTQEKRCKMTLSALENDKIDISIRTNGCECI
jgi:hypothetical protein